MSRAMTTVRALALRSVLRLALPFSLAMVGCPATAGVEPRAGAEQVHLERARPEPDEVKTLRFLRENRAFLRGRLDAVRTAWDSAIGAPTSIDARWIRHRAELDAARAALASSHRAAAEDSLNDGLRALAELESALEALERTAREQSERLTELRSELDESRPPSLVLLFSGASPSSEIAWTPEISPARWIQLDAQTKEALSRGGIVEAWNGYVEPRRQSFELASDGAVGYLTLAVEPASSHYVLVDLSSLGSDPTAWVVHHWTEAR